MIYNILLLTKEICCKIENVDQDKKRGTLYKCALLLKCDEKN